MWTALRKPLRYLGYDIVRVGINADLYLSVANLLRGRPAPLLFDVGANVGQTATRLAELSPRGRILSFEPAPATFQRLGEAVAGLPVEPLPIALGSRNVRQRFRMNRASVTNSFLETSHDPLAFSATDGGYVQEAEVEVEVRRLDDFCAERSIGRIDLLKADVQGYELELLKGAGDLLRPDTIELLALEVMFSPFYEGQCYFDELAGYLRERGYKLANLYDMDVHKDRGILQANALFFPASLRA
jgi:FkbM family methyltransferase